MPLQLKHVLLRSCPISLSYFVDLIQLNMYDRLIAMFPVLLTVGNINISSFGVFLGLGFLSGIFLIWRLSRAWDLDEEKVLDLTVLASLTGLFGARIYFVLENWPIFSDKLLNIIVFTRAPGFSFLGGLLGGVLGLMYFTKRFKVDFWQFADIASVGFLAGVIFGNLGCFFGGCNIGVASSFLSFPMVGAIGKRFAVQVLESLLLFIVLLKLYAFATHFHQRGKIASLSLIYFGLIKVTTEPLRALHEGFLLSLAMVVLGVTIYYRVMKKSLISDLKLNIKFIWGLCIDGKHRKMFFERLKKNWYNQKVAFLWQIRNINKLIRKLNVKISRKNSGYD